MGNPSRRLSFSSVINDEYHFRVRNYPDDRVMASGDGNVINVYMVIKKWMVVAVAVVLAGAAGLFLYCGTCKGNFF